MLGLGSLISPKAALNILRGAIVKTLGQDVEKYEVIYYHILQRIDFCIYNYKEKDGSISPKKLMNYPDAKKLIDILNSQLKDKVSTEDKLEYAIISYPENMLRLFTNHNGDLKKIEHKL